MNKTFLPNTICKLLVFAFIPLNCIIAQSDTWTQKSNFAGSSRSGAISFSIGTKGYLGTGVGEDYYYSKDFWEYDQENDTWSQIADLSNTRRAKGVGFSIGDKGYAGIGYFEDQSKNDIWEYDPQNNIWTKKANYPGTGKIAAVSFSIGDLGYVGTGSPTGLIGNETKEFWEYNPINDSWTRKADFSGTQRDRAIGFSIGSKGYLGTGYQFDGNKPISLHDFWEYDPISDLWTEKANVQELERSYGVGFSTGSKGYIGMGYLTKTDFWQYNPDSDSWLQVASFGGEERLSASAFSIGNKGYVGMGYSVDRYGTTFHNDIWEYTEPTLSLSENELENKFEVYPNPTTNILNVSQNKDIVEMIIYDLHGKKIKTIKKPSIDVSDFPSGIYYLKIITSNGQEIKKFIKN